MLSQQEQHALELQQASRDAQIALHAANEDRARLLRRIKEQALAIHQLSNYATTQSAAQQVQGRVHSNTEQSAWTLQAHQHAEVSAIV